MSVVMDCDDVEPSEDSDRSVAIMGIKRAKSTRESLS